MASVNDFESHFLKLIYNVDIWREAKGIYPYNDAGFDI